MLHLFLHQICQFDSLLCDCYILFKPWNITKTFFASLRFTLQLQWGAPLNFLVIWQWSLTFSLDHQFVFHRSNTRYLIGIFLHLLSHNEIFVKMFFHYIFTAIILFKNCFNKFKSTFNSIKNNWLAKFIITTNKF